MGRLFVVVSILLTLPAAPAYAAQSPSPGDTIRFAPVAEAAGTDGLPWTVGIWEGSRGGNFFHRGASGDVHALPLDGWTVQRKVGDHRLLFAVAGAALGALTGSLIASSTYEERWSNPIPAHCGFFGCVDAVPAELLNPGGAPVWQGAAAGAALGMLFGGLIGARNPRWAAIRFDATSVRVSVPSR